jgi:hypothetical protein
MGALPARPDFAGESLIGLAGKTGESDRMGIYAYSYSRLLNQGA